MSPDHHMYSAMGRDVESPEPDSSQLEKALLPEPEWNPGRQEYAVMVTLALISLMVALDATVLVSVLPTLAVELGGTATDAFWAGTSYLLSCAVCQPFIAALSDIFGRKELLLVSVLLFTLGTLLCAPIAKTFAVFFIGRAVQGIGGGGIITMGQVIYADIVPLRQRPKYFSIVLAAWALGSVLGPLVGGLFVEHVTWQWCFYINFPFCALGIVLVPLSVKLTTDKSSLVSKLSRVDWVGGFLFIGSLTSFLIGISWAGVQFEWKSVQTIAPIVAGVVGVTISILWEIYGAKEPFLRPSLFSSVSALATYACALFQGFILFCALYYVPFYFTAVKFHSPTQSGLDVFPVTCLLMPGSIVISLLTTRTGHYRWAIWSGWAVTAVGCGLLVLLDAETSTANWAVILAIFGIGHGMLLTSVNVGVQAVSRVEDAGRAAAMYAFMRTLGMSIGVAVGGTVFQNVMIKKLDELGLPHEIAHNAEAFVGKMALMSPDDPLRIAALQAYIHGFHGVYWVITGAAIAAFAISLIIRSHSMDKLLASEYTLKGSRDSSAALISNPSFPISSSSSDSNIPPPQTVAYTEKAYGHHPFYETVPLYTNDVASGWGGFATDSSGSTESIANFKHEPSHDQQTFYDPGFHSASQEQHEVAHYEEETAAVAYYIQPGGRIVPVHISPPARV